MVAPASERSASSPFAAATREFLLREVWARPQLSRRDRRFVTLACVASADVEDQIVEQVYDALASGDIGIEELREAVLHFAVYAGWPKASRFNSIVDAQWDRVCAERGVPTPPPPPLLPLTTPSEPLQRVTNGEHYFREINCLPVACFRENPYYGAGNLNFVFGEVWLRPNLGIRERRFVTVACVGFQDTPIPIMSHVYAALKSGDISFEEMDEIALQFAAYSGFAKAEQLNQIIGEQKARVEREAST